jgi:hypothetical protein
MYGNGDKEVTMEPEEPAAPGKVTFSYSPTWTLHNAKQATDLSFELRGPETPHPPTVEGTKTPSGHESS